MRFRILFLSLFLSQLYAYGAENVVGDPVAADALGSLLEALAGQHGLFLAALTWIGILRAVFKPVMTAVEAVVRATPGQYDDQLLARAEASAGYRTVCWLIDYLASVKVGTQRAPTIPPGVALFFLLLFLPGCASMRNEKFDPATGKRVEVSSVHSFMSKSAMEKLSVGHTTKTTSTGLSAGKADSDPNEEAIKAMGDGLSQVVSQAMKTDVKP